MAGGPHLDVALPRVTVTLACVKKHVRDDVLGGAALRVWEHVHVVEKLGVPAEQTGNGEEENTPEAEAPALGRWLDAQDPI